MSKQKLKDNEEIIIAMREAGKSRQKIADKLGLTKGQIKSWVTRYNRRSEKQARGIQHCQRGGHEKITNLRMKTELNITGDK